MLLLRLRSVKHRNTAICMSWQKRRGTRIAIRTLESRSEPGNSQIRNTCATDSIPTFRGWRGTEVCLSLVQFEHQHPPKRMDDDNYQNASVIERLHKRNSLRKVVHLLHCDKVNDATSG